MEHFNRKNHWEQIYQTKKLEAVSWFQQTPETSLRFVRDLQLPLRAKIIDIGGGDSLFVDHLLDLGYTNITVLDISAQALERARKRLGDRAHQVHWIEADVVQFDPKETYDFWHDRAAFHFLTQEHEIARYVQTAHQSLAPEGRLVLGTFSTQGPRTCSGIEIKQYTEASISARFASFFKKINGLTVDHITPNNAIQPFIFCSFAHTSSTDIPPRG